MVASRIDSVRNCLPDQASPCSEGASEADLGSAFEYGDEHVVGDADGADEGATCPYAR
jgi:hypothetical protein